MTNELAWKTRIGAPDDMTMSLFTSILVPVESRTNPRSVSIVACFGRTTAGSAADARIALPRPFDGSKLAHLVALSEHPKMQLELVIDFPSAAHVASWSPSQLSAVPGVQPQTSMGQSAGIGVHVFGV